MAIVFTFKRKYIQLCLKFKYVRIFAFFLLSISRKKNERFFWGGGVKFPQ